VKSNGGAPKILIVEDEAIIGLDIKRMLVTAGNEVTALASTAEDAIRAIGTNPPDLVLMDIHLRGPVDGIDAAERIRLTAKLPVVFVTAHADKRTLERARLTQPFGYIVKPISSLSLVSTIEMALHKHQVERQLEEHRAWLSTILQSIPDAVCVTDLAGEVQFVNEAAEALLGAKQEEVLGQAVDSVLPLANGEQYDLASKLLDKAEWGNRVAVPKETLLRRAPVEGDVAISYIGGEPAGAIFTLRDIARREQEESVLRQEERMQALGHLAANVARDFSSLHSLLGDTGEELTQLAARLPNPSLDPLINRERASLLDKADTISRVSSLGALMAQQLTQLNVPPSVRATLVSASGVVASVEPLMAKLARGSLQVDVHLTDESTLVLCHADRLRTLLVNVFLNAHERMAGSGRIRISTSQVGGKRVLILFEVERIGVSAWRPLAFPLEMDNPDFSLSIAQAIAAAMEGSITFTASSETQGKIEIRLPLQHATQDLVNALNRRGTALLIGSELEILNKVEERMESAGYGVIRCSSAAEAVLLGQLHEAKIDFVIAGGEGISAANRKRVYDFFSSRNSAAKFVLLAEGDEPEEQGWRPFPKSPKDSAAERLAKLLAVENRRTTAAGE
jgi:PAS domain S-box-containing protein